MISRIAIVTGLQSRQIWEKTPHQKCKDAKNKVLGIKKVINMTAVMILVIPLIIFAYGSLHLMLVPNKLVFYGQPIKKLCLKSLWVDRKIPTYLALASSVDYHMQR